MASRPGTTAAGKYDVSSTTGTPRALRTRTIRYTDSPDRHVEDAREVAGGEHLFPLEQAADRGDALADRILEKAAQLARVLTQFRVGDERAAALATHDQVSLDEPVHRRTNRHAAHTELTGRARVRSAARRRVRIRRPRSGRRAAPRSEGKPGHSDSRALTSRARHSGSQRPTSGPSSLSKLLDWTSDPVRRSPEDIRLSVRPGVDTR